MKEKRRVDDPSQFEMPLTEHLEELRRRIIYCLIAVTFFSLGAYFFSDRILHFLTYPIRKFFPELKLVFIKPTEPFLTYLKASFLTGFFISSPFIIYQIWAFVSPGLYRHERKYALLVLIPTFILFFLGIFFAFVLGVPFGLRFLIGYYISDLNPMISIKEYISFLFTLLLGFGIAFTSPVFIIMLSALGLINYEDIKNFHPYIVVLIFVIAAILTPPDVFTQIILALPLLLLFEISLIGVRLIEWRRRFQK